MSLPSRRDALEASAWAGRWPGLRPEARRWLDDLPGYLHEADERSEQILATSFSGGGLLRLGQLAASAAPHLRPLLSLRGDVDRLVPVLAEMAVRGGPTYVKLGQVVSSTRGIVPDWIAEAFEGCRDAVPPASVAEVKSILRRSGIEEGLRTWEHYPIASASVAQVHRATLHDGTDVVVKVRRPRIIGTVAADVSYLAPLLEVAEAGSSRARMANLSGSLELMIRLFAQEVDLRLEAANIAEMALALERTGLNVKLPAPVPGLVTKHAMVMEYVEGASWADAAGVALQGHEGTDLVRVLIGGVLETTLVEGIFHGDLHPGNVFVNRDGLALVDFGIVGRLDAAKRQAVAGLLFALIARDRLAALHALKDLGAIPAHVDPEDILPDLLPSLSEDDLRDLGNDRRAAADRFAGIQRVLAERGFRIVPEMALLGRDMVYLGDAIERHAPDFDLVSEIGKLVIGMQQRQRAGGEPA